MANEEEYRQARDNAVIKFKEAWDACLEFAILNGLPNELPNYDLEIKRAYMEIETLEETIEARDATIAELKNTIEILMSNPSKKYDCPEPKNFFQAWWYQSRLYETIQTIRRW